MFYVDQNLLNLLPALKPVFSFTLHINKHCRHLTHVLELEYILLAVSLNDVFQFFFFELVLDFLKEQINLTSFLTA